MPIYDYECLDCSNKFDSLVSYRDAEKKQPCMKCGSLNTKKLLSTSFGVDFSKAGAGIFKNDYKTKTGGQ
jgi:putative FmdB family regulatory protein